jgi:hypothetical protein
MRPIYETSENRNSEQAVADLLASTWKTTILKLPKLAKVDRLVVAGGNVRAWLEIKCRYNPMHTYLTYMISARKIQDGLDLSEATKLPFILVVSWSDGVCWTKVESMYPTRSGGRVDRGDAQDIELVCDIPLDMRWHKI